MAVDGRRAQLYCSCHVGITKEIGGNVDKETRLALFVLVMTIAAWRFARYMRLGLSRSRRATSLGVASGDWSRGTRIGRLRPRTHWHPLRVPSIPVLLESSWPSGLWLAINALLWYSLFELPPLRSLPPVPVGVVGIFANFYLIPLARRTGARSRRRIDEARARTESWPTSGS